MCPTLKFSKVIKAHLLKNSKVIIRQDPEGSAQSIPGDPDPVEPKAGGGAGIQVAVNQHFSYANRYNPLKTRRYEGRRRKRLRISNLAAQIA